jgi:hypothetical protein
MKGHLSSEAWQKLYPYTRNDFRICSIRIFHIKYNQNATKCSRCGLDFQVGRCWTEVYTCTICAEVVIYISECLVNNFVDIY